EWPCRRIVEANERSMEDPVSPDLPLYRKARRSADDAPRGHQADDQEHQEQQQEQTSEKLGNRKRCPGDRREAEQGSDEPDHEKNERHVKHDQTSVPGIAKPVPCRAGVWGGSSVEPLVCGCAAAGYGT